MAVATQLRSMPFFSILPSSLKPAQKQPMYVDGESLPLWNYILAGYLDTSGWFVYVSPPHKPLSTEWFRPYLLIHGLLSRNAIITTHSICKMTSNDCITLRIRRTFIQDPFGVLFLDVKPRTCSTCDLEDPACIQASLLAKQWLEKIPITFAPHDPEMDFFYSVPLAYPDNDGVTKIFMLFEVHSFTIQSDSSASNAPASAPAKPDLSLAAPTPQKPNLKNTSILWSAIVKKKLSKGKEKRASLPDSKTAPPPKVAGQTSSSSATSP
jgi:hypothetical protein